MTCPEPANARTSDHGERSFAGVSVGSGGVCSEGASFVESTQEAKITGAANKACLRARRSTLVAECVARWGVGLGCRKVAVVDFEH